MGGEIADNSIDMPDFNINIPRDLPPEFAQKLESGEVDVNQSGAIDNPVELAPALKFTSREIEKLIGTGMQPPSALIMFKVELAKQIEANMNAAYGRFDGLLRCSDKTYTEMLADVTNQIRENNVKIVGVGEIHHYLPDELYVPLLQTLKDNFGIGVLMEEGVPSDPNTGVATDDKESGAYKYIKENGIRIKVLPVGSELLDADKLSNPFIKEVEGGGGNGVVIAHLGICHLVGEESRRLHDMTVATFNEAGYSIASDNTSVIYGNGIPIYDFPSLMGEMEKKKINTIGIGFSYLIAEARSLMQQQYALFLNTSLSYDQYNSMLQTAVKDQRKLYDAVKSLPKVGGYYAGIAREDENMFSVRYVRDDEVEFNFSPAFLEALYNVMSNPSVKAAYEKGQVWISVRKSPLYNLDGGSIRISAGNKDFFIETDRKTGVVKTKSITGD